MAKTFKGHKREKRKILNYVLPIRISPRWKWPKMIKNKKMDEYIVDQLTCNVWASAGGRIHSWILSLTPRPLTPEKIITRASKIKLPQSLLIFSSPSWLLSLIPTACVPLTCPQDLDLPGHAVLCLRLPSKLIDLELGTRSSLNKAILQFYQCSFGHERSMKCVEVVQPRLFSTNQPFKYMVLCRTPVSSDIEADMNKEKAGVPKTRGYRKQSKSVLYMGQRGSFLTDTR